MFDLDAAQKVENYKLKFQGKEHTFDTLVVISSLAENARNMTTPAAIRDGMNKIFGLTFSTNEAMLVLRDFEQFADNFEESVKNLFGHQPSSTTTTDSTQTQSESLTQETVSA
jgi:hypothetical protein